VRQSGEILSSWEAITDEVGLSENTIRKLVKDEDFPIQFVGRTPITTMGQILSWLDQQIERQKRKTCQ